ncbi:MAG: hypothetical protein IT203_03725 [Fimbriimonadaceae bacterium]|nr:hypothetical protein [Fimbriimonadaceae bacterium]
MILGITFLFLTQAKPSKPPVIVFADAETRKIVEQSKRAFAGFKSGVLSITNGNERKVYALSGSAIAAKQMGAQWVYGNKSLLLQCKKGLFKGNMGPYNVNAWLGRVGANAEILPIQLFAKKNPIDAVIPLGARVKKVGALQVGGVWVDLVEANSATIRVSMGIRRDNHLLASLSAVNKDRDGKTLFSSERTIHWSGLNQAPAPTAFQLGAGKAAKSIKLLK